MGSEGNAKTVEYVAREFARIGLQPAGDNGGWFQTLPVVVRKYDAGKPLSFGDRVLTPWRDFLPRDQGAAARSLDGVETVFGGLWGDTAQLIRADQGRGKLVVLLARADEMVPNGRLGLPSRQAVAAYFSGVKS